MKRTVVIGASPNPSRYAYKATVALKENGIETYAIGIREGNIEGTEILTDMPKIVKVDTVTMYVGAKNQPVYYDYILSMKPRRIIFNPGAENAVLSSKAREMGIQVENACTLVLLRLGDY